jgi:hypothetical protein
MHAKKEKRKSNTFYKEKREREHLIDVKENNLRSKESLMRDDRQREKREKKRQGRESFTFFLLFYYL